MPVFAPIPKANEAIATAVNPLSARNLRAPRCRSCASGPSDFTITLWQRLAARQYQCVMYGSGLSHLPSATWMITATLSGVIRVEPHRPPRALRDGGGEAGAQGAVGMAEAGLHASVATRRRDPRRNHREAAPPRPRAAGRRRRSRS